MRTDFDQHYALVELGGRLRVADLGDATRTLSQATFRRMFVNRAGNAWLAKQSPAAGLVFRPDKPFPKFDDGQTWVNLYRGRPFEAKQGDWSAHRQVLEQDICNGDTEALEQLLRIMARLWQRPGEPAAQHILLAEDLPGLDHWFCDLVGGLVHPQHYLPGGYPSRYLSEINIFAAGLLVATDNPAPLSKRQAERFVCSAMAPRITVRQKFEQAHTLDNPVLLILLPMGGEVDPRIVNRCLVLESRYPYLVERLPEITAAALQAMAWDLARID